MKKRLNLKSDQHCADNDSAQPRYYLRHYSYENGKSWSIWHEITPGYYLELLDRGFGNDLRMEGVK